MLTDKLARVSLAHLPTPLEPLERLSARLNGPELWVKRDDQTGLATGGNKTRKLEFLVAHALELESDMLLTCGAAQSNHARQTAAAAARFGLACGLILSGEEPARVQGNLLLDHLLGAAITWAGEEDAAQVMARVAEELRAKDRRPYVVPYGGSNPVGVSGYVAAMEELLEQCEQQGMTFDHIVLATSSGGTQAGLMVAARALDYAGRILGISVAPPAGELQAEMAGLAQATAAHVGLSLTFGPEDFAVEDGYVGGGYAVIGDREREAIHTLAHTEGLLLDPVYTGRAFGGLLDMARHGIFTAGERVLFWHTGGIPGLFGYVEGLNL